MKSITAGLCLSLIGGVALAQTPPIPASPPPAAQPMPPQAAPAPGTQAKGADPAGPPEGEIIETPNGVSLMRPGQRPRPLDIRPSPGRMASSDMADDQGMQPPHPPRPPHPRPEGKGARFRMHTPSMTVGVKCPEEESMKACVDAISELLDKAAPQPHT